MRNAGMLVAILLGNRPRSDERDKRSTRHALIRSVIVVINSLDASAFVHRKIKLVNYYYSICFARISVMF